MGRNCSICSHAESKSIVQDILNGVKYRVIRQRYGVSQPAITNHVQHHLAGPLHRLAEAEHRLNEDVALVQPALRQIQHLNDQVRRIAAAAERSKDFATAIAALREVRHGIELLAKLTGELDRSLTPEEGALELRVVYREPRAVTIDVEPAPARLSSPNGHAD
jgi:hypothetical protein